MQSHIKLVLISNVIDNNFNTYSLISFIVYTNVCLYVYINELLDIWGFILL